MEFLTKLVEMDEDHLKDAQMITDWAIEAKYAGNTEARDFFHAEAHERLKKHEALSAKIHACMAKWPAADMHTREAIFCEIVHKKMAKWAMKIKEQLATL